MSELSARRLQQGLADASTDAGITISSRLEPLAGPHGTVKPAGYAGSRHQVDRRWYGDPPAVVDTIVIDNVPSQANRMEAALRRLRGRLGLPEILLDLGGISTLPPHLARSISSFTFPHRQGDAYLRDSTLDGADFANTPTGVALLNATVDAPGPLVQWFPQALLFGFWQSHLGKKRSQAKLSRAFVSEIVGYDPAKPASDPTRTLGVKGDPINLSITEQAMFSEDDLLEPWSIDEGTKREKVAPGRSRKALSEIGHGQVPFKSDDTAALSAVSFREIAQQSTISFAALRRLHAASADATPALRALIASLGVVGHVAAFGSSFHLRSGCDLRPMAAAWMWLGGAKDEAVDAPTLDEAVALFEDSRRAADEAGLLTGGGWGAEPLVLQPKPSLVNAIALTWPLPSLTAP